MILWLAFALLLTGTVAALLMPLLRSPAGQPARTEYDLAVYRNQLAEVESDVERGLVSADQAEGARLEIQRRMLAASSAAAPPTDNRQARVAAAVVIALVVPVGAGLFYAAEGHPRIQDQPYAYRLEHDPDVILASAAQTIEADLRARPSVPGYQRLADLYLLQHDYDHAVLAFRRAIQLGDNTADTWGRLGEAYVLASGGAVSPPALAAFAHALMVDAREPRSRYYAGMAQAQIGNLKAAVAVWRDLVNDSRPEAPWLPVLNREIAMLGKQGGFDPATVPPSPPSAASLTAAVEAMQKAMGGAMGNSPQ